MADRRTSIANAVCEERGFLHDLSLPLTQQQGRPPTPDHRLCPSMRTHYGIAPTIARPGDGLYRRIPPVRRGNRLSVDNRWRPRAAP